MRDLVSGTNLSGSSGAILSISTTIFGVGCWLAASPLSLIVSAKQNDGGVYRCEMGWPSTQSMVGARSGDALP